jgi:hypothetical protein
MTYSIRSLCLMGGCLALVGAVALGNRTEEPAKTPLPEPMPQAKSGPRYWKGNLHTHTLWSDGDDYPEMAADWYKTQGYNFLAITDHNVIAEADRWIDESAKTNKGLEKYLARFGSGWVERREVKGKKQIRLKPLREFRTLLDAPGQFQLFPAEEISAAYAQKPIHINGINLLDVIPAAKAESVAETIDVNFRAVDAQRKKTTRPMIAFLNHPNFRWGVRAEDMLSVESLRFFEVYNGHPTVFNKGDETHVSTDRIWDILLALRLGKLKLPLLYGLGTDDTHNYHEFAVGKSNPGRAWVMVRSQYLTPESIIRAMEAGDFYASSGVTLNDVSREGNELRIAIKPEAGISYKTQFIVTNKDATFDSKPRTDAEGKVLDVTNTYSDEIGKVALESTDLNPTYKLTGNELYVRAKIISSKPHPNPSEKGDVETAWTQPIVP